MDIEGHVSPLRVIAVWACRVGSIKSDYIGQLYEAFNEHPDWFTCRDTVVAGDFNSNSIWDHNHPVGSHTSVVKTLEGHGIVSAYHEFFGEAQGKETRMTLDFRKDRHESFHIDYIFIPKSWRASLRDVSIGGYKKWTALSDHRPMVVVVDSEVLGMSRMSDRMIAADALVRRVPEDDDDDEEDDGQQKEDDEDEDKEDEGEGYSE